VLRLLLLLCVTTAFLAQPAFAQEAPTSIDGFVEDTASLRQAVVPTVLLVTLLSIAPGILMMVTCFPFITIIFSFIRQGLGLQTAPPAMMLTSLALFLTWFTMEPVFQDAWSIGIAPLMEGELTETDGLAAAAGPFAEFMEARTSEDTLNRLAEAVGRSVPEAVDADLSLLIPSFMLSEITRAFQIGFAVFLPFLIVDLVVASVLMAMGMMMVPPAVVALPFKLAFFVLADGWVAITEALLKGYS
jgi:flagellar biosynthetic protein FliP